MRELAVREGIFCGSAPAARLPEHCAWQKLTPVRGGSDHLRSWRSLPFYRGVWEEHFSQGAGI